MTVFYASFKLLMKGSLRTYFKKIRIEGVENIPRDRPLLITPNHQNAFLDALIVGAFSPRELYFLTRSDVFTKWSIPLMKLVNMMPIYRIRDGYSKLSLNEEVFDRCRQVFDRNKSILIFAEGNHGKEYFLRPLTKGAARLALQSQMKMENELMIQPVGLNYFDHQSPKSTVVVRFGESISVSKYLEDFQKHEATGLIKMRDAIANGMRSTLILPDETIDYEERRERIFQEENENMSFHDLKSMNVKDISVNQKKRKKHLLAKTVNPFPFFLIYKVISKVEDVVFHSSLKFAIALFAFPIWWSIVFVVVSSTIGINTGLLAVAVMAFGLFYSYQS
ncbi:MAG: 1-acyl-sn-glycerol-3-phosphate acyltransferase [Bacteroidota bacterium]